MKGYCKTVGETAIGLGMASGGMSQRPASEEWKRLREAITALPIMVSSGRILTNSGLAWHYPTGIMSL